MRKPKTEEQLTKDLEIIIRKLNRSMTGNTQDNLARIDLKVAEIMKAQKEIEQKRLERRAKQEEKEKAKSENRERREERTKTAIQMMQNGIDPKIIADMLEYNNVASIYQMLRKYNIASIRSVMQQLSLQEQDDETIAKQANWVTEAVSRLREELHQEKAEMSNHQDTNIDSSFSSTVNTEIQSTAEKAKGETTDRTSQTTVLEKSTTSKASSVQSNVASTETPKAQPVQQIVPKRVQVPRKNFFEMARNITDLGTMARELQMSVAEIRGQLKKSGYYDRKKVVELIHNGKTNEEISSKGGVTQEAVQRVREEEKRKLAEQTTPQAMEITLLKQKQEAEIERARIERRFLLLAKRFEKESKIAHQLQITYYEVMLLLRKYGITPRADLERMIEQDLDISSEVIATKINGDVEAIEKVKKAVKEREKLINAISFETQEKLIRQLAHGSISIDYIATKLNIPAANAKAIAKKWERDKNFHIPESIKKRNFKRDMNTLRVKVEMVKEETITADTKRMWEGCIDKILVEYEPFITHAEYAFICYTYMKMRDFYRGIEIARDYLELKDHTVCAVKAKIYEIIENEKAKKKQETLLTSSKVPEKEQNQR